MQEQERQEQEKLEWEDPEIVGLDLVRNTRNAGPTFLDTGAFS